jgi:hypothetical protein
MAGKGSGSTGKTECAANIRLPGKMLARDEMGTQGGGGTRDRDGKESSSQPHQSLPAGFNSGGQGAYPHGPLTTRDYHGTRAQPNQHLPAGHFEDGMSKGEAAECVRGADAYQGPREGESK